MSILEKDDRVDVAKKIVSRANHLRIHSGNIINSISLKNGVGQKSSEELSDALENAINSWTSSIEPDLMGIRDPLDIVDITNRLFVKKFKKEERENLKFSVKIFLPQWRPELIRQAVDQVCQSLEVSSLDSVIITFPAPSLINITNNNNNTTPEFSRIKVIWKELEYLVDTGNISHIGVTDFDKQGLEELHKWSKIKPSINQIRMSNCCTVPEDLIEFSKEYDIELLSHNDGAEILTEKSFQCLMQDAVPHMDSSKWLLSYVARYSVILRCRGIVEAIGYVVGAEREVTSNSLPIN